VGSSVLERIVRTEPLVSAGKSGSALERGWLDDGSAVVVKHADARHDWIMQATQDSGRIAALWSAGLFDQLPEAVDHAMLDVQPAPGGSVVVMRDVSARLFADSTPSTVQREVVLRSATEMHDALGGLDSLAPDLCSLGAYLTFLSPETCSRFAADHEVPRLALEGWGRFREIVDDDVVAVVDAVHADPSALANALLARRSTVVHGDLKLANLGVDGERAVVLDWGTLTTWAPPAVDFAWYLAINAAATGLPHDALLAEIRAAQGTTYDAVGESLALVGAFGQLGWEKALGATSDDPLVASRERAGLDWWASAARAARRLV
jgi:aminoglycoside phosphotransferase (APT) family kinase protein